ncbi:hypothetical protein OKA06_20045 [Novosphingobium sp. MW5]|nr:hypothetical protein [Novosphingobium sp. MW5]
MVKPSVSTVTRRWPAAVEAQLAESYGAVLNTSDKPLSPTANCATRSGTMTPCCRR